MISLTLSNFEGALLGCAVGDALGAPFEGLWRRDIPDDLLDRFHEYDGYPTGQFTDDTQLTLATVEAIIEAEEVSPFEIARQIGELWRTAAVIGPGGACMEAGDTYLRTGNWRTCGAPPGRAGNGTAMRTGILGLCMTAKEIPTVVADISRITHQDTRSVAGGVGIAALVNSLAASPDSTPEKHLSNMAESMKSIEPSFADLILGLDQHLGKTSEETKEYLAWPDAYAHRLEAPIITPYVVPTVLASVWSVLSYPDSWETAVDSVIRLGGDVDTTGAIVGTIQGAKLGAAAVPEHLFNAVQEQERILVLAQRLYSLWRDRLSIRGS